MTESIELEAGDFRPRKSSVSILRAPGVSSALAIALVATPVLAAQTFGEVCSGSEVVQVGSQPPENLPYALDFSADLAGRVYCYAACGKTETYPISDPSSAPIKLADEKNPFQARYITFDPRTAVITDYQVISMGRLPALTRRASATCTSGIFHQPWSQPKPGP